MSSSNVIRGMTTVTRSGPGKIILTARTFGRCFRRDFGQSWQTGRARRDVATSAGPPNPSKPPRMPRTRRRKKELNRDPVQGVAPSAPRRVFVEYTLQGPPMHFEAPGGLGDIASALFKHSLDVFPAHPVCRHRILGWTGQWPLHFQ